MVKIFAFLELEPRLNIKNGFNWTGKNEHFSKVSPEGLSRFAFRRLSEKQKNQKLCVLCASAVNKLFLGVVIDYSVPVSRMSEANGR